VTPAQASYQAHLAARLLPHGLRPTPKHLKVVRLAARWQHPTPSHSKLARAAGCCVRTVQNALNRLRGLGMLSWVHRGRTTPSGRRLQAANRYTWVASFSLFTVPLQEEQKKSLNPNLHVGKLSDEALQELRIKWGLA
jgi:AraC-like DNA-binding protein